MPTATPIKGIINATASLYKGKIGVLIEDHYDPTEFEKFNEYFPQQGYDVEYISHLWGNPSLTFWANPEEGVIKNQEARWVRKVCKDPLVQPGRWVRKVCKDPLVQPERWVRKVRKDRPGLAVRTPSSAATSISVPVRRWTTRSGCLTRRVVPTPYQPHIVLAQPNPCAR